MDRPEFLAGTAVPDWLSVSDRRSRVRTRHIQARLTEASETERELLAGMQQHLDDDHWFHNSPGFYTATARMSERFRDALPGDDWQCGFLGHIVMELLLDAVLIEQFPDRILQYYEVMARVQGDWIVMHVDRVATQPTSRLAEFIPLFVRERFLEDYVDNVRLLFRLNQVMKRVKLPPLPDQCLTVLEQGRDIVRHQLPQLLPPKNFGPLSFT